MKQQQKRATFVDTCVAQDKIRKIIDACIEENCVLSKTEREYFIDQMDIATLGLGVDKPFFFKGAQGSYRYAHIEQAAYWLAYQTNNQVKLGEEYVDIQQLWKQLRFFLFDIFPYAKATSAKISKEQTHLGPAQAGRV